MLQTVGLRWRILLKVLPFTLLFCLIKFGVYLLGWEIGTFDPLTGSVFGAVTLVTAFFLAGTLNDFKVSEVLPLEICSAIEGMNDTNILMAADHAEYSPAPFLEALIDTLKTIQDWLVQNGDATLVFNQINKLNQRMVPLNQVTPPPLMSKVQAELSRLRLATMRIRVIRDTDFLISAYTLLQLYTVGAVIALVLISGDNFGRNLLLSVILVTGIFYLLVLIQDLDNPFQYDGHSSVDVDLQDFNFTLARLQLQLEQILLAQKENLTQKESLTQNKA